MARSPEREDPAYLTLLEQYLEPPYLWELPPTEERLMPGDPHYEHYMCRGNLLTVISGCAQELAKEPGLSERARQEIRAASLHILERARAFGPQRIAAATGEGFDEVVCYPTAAELGEIRQELARIVAIARNDLADYAIAA